MIQRSARLALVCLVGTILAGCGGVYHITRVTPPKTSKEKQDGVLYYAKVGVCRHETKYEEPVFDVVVTNTETKAVELQRSLGLTAYLDFLKQMTADKSADAIMILNRETEYEEAGFNKPPLAGGLLLIANRNILETVVDYRHQYYFNARQPISGSATAAIKSYFDLVDAVLSRLSGAASQLG